MDILGGSVLFLNKPYGWTSFDLVRKVQNMVMKTYNCKKIKIGHAGTLDPLADGLMILCTGKMTKQIDSYQAKEKEYVAKIFLGATTPSFDLETEVDAQYDTAHITKQLFEETVKGFIGTQEQTPPSFSAKKIDGKRAYKKARKGEMVEIKPVTIDIPLLEVLSFDLPYAEIKIVCSKGTYIRTLTHDIGKALGSGAYMAGLKRTRIGEYKLEDSMSLDQVAQILKESVAAHSETN
jgi:tRNA pseudouridine55 synthase